VENGSFQTRLANLEFLEKSREHIESDSSTANYKPSERLSSASALLRQNEDLSARLKMAMEKLIYLEDQMDQRETDYRTMEKTNESLRDQMLIWKEKERLWIEKLEKSEIKNQEIEAKIPAYEPLKNELSRYKKYHEKIKTQVKPYIQQLKDYSKGLLEQIRELNREIMNQKHALDAQNIEIANLKSDISARVTSQTLALDEVEKIHQKETESMRTELARLRQENIVLNAKSDRMEQSLSRQDELENTCVVLKRNLENMGVKIQTETEGLRQSLQMARNEITKKNLQIESYETQTQELKMALTKYEQDATNLNDQLISLRYLWEEKSSQLEQKLAMIQSLEKLNLELSQKLNFNSNKNQSPQINF
jgi:hypothetical protein